MKKPVLSLIALLLLAASSFAADKTEDPVNSRVENKTEFSAASVIAPATSYAMVSEENLKLKIQAAELTSKLDDVQSRLDYTQMMHSTLTNLQHAVMINVVEDAKSQLDYARMMHATLMNLNRFLK